MWFCPGSAVGRTVLPLRFAPRPGCAFSPTCRILRAKPSAVRNQRNSDAEIDYPKDAVWLPRYPALSGDSNRWNAPCPMACRPHLRDLRRRRGARFPVANRRGGRGKCPQLGPRRFHRPWQTPFGLSSNGRRTCRRRQLQANKGTRRSRVWRAFPYPGPSFRCGRRGGTPVEAERRASGRFGGMSVGIPPGSPGTVAGLACRSGQVSRQLCDTPSRTPGSARSHASSSSVFVSRTSGHNPSSHPANDVRKSQAHGMPRVARQPAVHD